MNEYQSGDAHNFASNTAYKVAYVIRYLFSASGHEYSIQKWSNYSRWMSLKSTLETSYSSVNTDSLSVLTDYYYDNLAHMMPTRVEKILSDGRKEVAHTLYPPDYAAGTPFIDQMRAKHLLNFPVEEVTSIGDRVVTGTVNEYRIGGNGLKDGVYVLEITEPVALSGYKFSNRAIGVYPVGSVATVYGRDSRYAKRITFNSYTAKGSILQYTNNDFIYSYLWDHTNDYPVAEAKGASGADLAYTSFEDEANGNWNVPGTDRVSTSSLTGKLSYSLTGGSLSKSGLNIGTVYKVSFWAGAGAAVAINGIPVTATGEVVDGWSYYQREVSGNATLTIAGSGLIDEVRLHPVTSQFSSLTYEPLKGISTQCTSDNKIIYYEYDALGRLSVLRDQHKNVLQVIDYKYKAPINQ